jgi:hypothetical protein
MSARLERILVKLARQHAPHLALPQRDEQMTEAEHLQRLARALNAYSLLVLAGDLPPEVFKAREMYIHEWITAYGQFYNLLAHALFPSFSRIQAYYADDHLPPVVVIQGEATPVIHAMAGFVVPYLAIRQQSESVSDLELRGLMNIVLEELEGGDLSPAVVTYLVDQGVGILKTLLAAKVQHVALTAFERPILSELEIRVPAAAAPPPEAIPERPGALPEQQALTYALEQLPEDENDPPTPTEEMFSVDIPLGFGPKSPRRPPVPPLPES